MNFAAPGPNTAPSEHQHRGIRADRLPPPLRHLLAAARRYSLVAAALVGLAALAGWLIAGLRAPVYEAQSILLMRDPLAGEDPRVVSPTAATTLLMEPQVLSGALELAGVARGVTPQDLARDHLRFRDLPGTRFVEITVRMSDPAVAVKLANELPAAASRFQDHLWVGAGAKKREALATQLELSGKRLDELANQLAEAGYAPADARLEAVEAELRAERASLQQRERDRDLHLARSQPVDEALLAQLQVGVNESRRRVAELQLAIARHRDISPATSRPARELQSRWRAAFLAHEELIEMDEMERVKPRVPIFQLARPARDAARSSMTRTQAGVLAAVVSAMLIGLALMIAVVRAVEASTGRPA